MISEHRGPNLSTPYPYPSTSEKNQSPEYNIPYDDDAPDSLALLEPNPGGLKFSDDLWMVDITGVDQDIILLHHLTLADSLAAYNLSIEVSAYKDTEEAHKYQFTYRANFIHNIASQEKAGYIYLPVSTYPTISDNLSVDSSNPDLCGHKPEDYIFEYK